jgi:hypothetical protein
MSRRHARPRSLPVPPWLPVAALVAGLFGCQPSGPPSVSEEELAAGRLELVAEREGQDQVALDLVAERQLKASQAAPLPVVRPVERDAYEASLAAEAGSRLPPDARSTLAVVDVPVLVPDEASLLDTAVATSGATWYALSMQGEGFGLYLHATRTGQQLPVPPEEPPALPTREAPRVTFNEGSPSLSFRQWGVSYSLFVECEDPEWDLRCTQDAFVRDLASRLRRLDGGVR